MLKRNFEEFRIISDIHKPYLDRAFAPFELVHFTISLSVCTLRPDKYSVVPRPPCAELNYPRSPVVSPALENRTTPSPTSAAANRQAGHPSTRYFCKARHT